jgi:hemoglobin/transferrin/lactoferrin receptor protein
MLFHEKKKDVARLRRAVAALALLSNVAWAAPAPAQAPAEPREPGVAAQSPAIPLEELTVTGTKTRRSPIETPGETNVVPREDIERSQAQDLEDVLRYQPGVEILRGPRRISQEPIIRGLTGPRILVNVDGARLNFQFGHRGRIFLDMDDLKQVEIARGPVSALWGSGALGGVVAFTTRDPSDVLGPAARWATGIKLGYQGGNEEFLWSPTVAARLLPNLEALLTYTSRDADDIRLGGDLGRLRNSAETLDSGLGKVVWRPTRHDEVKLSALVSSEDGKVPSNTATEVTRTNPLVDRDTTLQVYSLRYTRHDPTVPWLDLAATAYVTALDVHENLVTGSQRDELDFDTYGTDIRNTTRLGTPAVHAHALTYGVEYYHDRQKSRRNRVALPTVPDADADSVGLYLQDEITLWKRLIVIPGFRWDWFKNEPNHGNSTSDNRLSPKIGAVLKATDFLYLESNYARGFRAPTFGELFVAGTHFPGAVFVPNPDLRPEKSENIDVGFRIRTERLFSAKDRFRFRNAYFRNSVEDFIDLRRLPGAPPLRFQNINIQDALIQGYEAEWSWEPLPGLTALGNFTYTRGRDENSRQALATIPPEKLVLGLDYYLAPWDVTVGGRAQIVGGQEDVPPGTSPTAGYTVYDLFLTWTPRWLKGFRLTAGVDNVTDKRYRRHTAPLPEAGVNPKATVSYVLTW